MLLSLLGDSLLSRLGDDTEFQQICWICNQKPHSEKLWKWGFFLTSFWKRMSFIHCVPSSRLLVCPLLHITLSQSGGCHWHWMRVDINSALSSISAFAMDLKRIQTPHTLFFDFGADKSFTTRWSGGRVQVWVQVRAPAGHLAITSEGCSRRQFKF